MSSELRPGYKRAATEATLAAIAAYFALVGLLFFIDHTFFHKVKFPSEWHKEAVDAGKAEYYLDEHHERQWRWKP
jgi:hypothetical protein